MPDFTDCMWKDSARCEIFIVSSQRTYGIARSGRDRGAQAILYIEESWIPDENGPLDQIVDDEGFRAIISVLGVGIDVGYGYDSTDVFDLGRIHYNRIILATDDSPTGDKVRRQVLAFLYLYMRPVLTSGHVYTCATRPTLTISEADFESQILSPLGRALKPVVAQATLTETLDQL